MKKMPPAFDREEEEREEQARNFKPLTADEARQLRERSPQISPWRVIAGQIIAGLVVALAAWGSGWRQYSQMASATSAACSASSRL